MNELVIFSLGVAFGAAAIYLPWIAHAVRRYVVSCGNANCPHHGPDIRRAIQARNEAERTNWRGPRK